MWSGCGVCMYVGWLRCMLFGVCIVVVEWCFLCWWCGWCGGVCLVCCGGFLWWWCWCVYFIVFNINKSVDKLPVLVVWYVLPCRYV